MPKPEGDVRVSEKVAGPAVGPPVLQILTTKVTGWPEVMPVVGPKMDLVIVIWGVGVAVGQVLVKLKVCWK